MFPQVRKLKLGELLLEAKVLTQEQLDFVLALPREPGQKFGQLLVDRGLIAEGQLTQLLSQQLSVPWVSLHHVEFSRALLDLVPGELAARLGLIPVLVRRRRGETDTLVVATEDPLVDGIVDAVALATGMQVKLMIASQSDVRGAIRAYYGIGEDPAGEPSGETPVPISVGDILPESGPPPMAAAESRRPTTPAPPEQLGRERLATLPAETEFASPTESAPSVSEEQTATTFAGGISVSGTASSGEYVPEASATALPDVAPIQEKKRKGRRVTLLDGTSFLVPDRAVRGAAGASQEATALDVVAKLRKIALSRSPTEGALDWEPIVGALVTVLLRKRLIADWELVEELRRFAPKK